MLKVIAIGMLLVQAYIYGYDMGNIKGQKRSQEIFEDLLDI